MSAPVPTVMMATLVVGPFCLPRNLGLITGASVTGAVFAGWEMSATFTLAAGLVGVARLAGFRSRRA